MNLAYISPFPPTPSGVADYSAVLLPYLRPHFAHLVVVADGVESQGDAGADVAWWNQGRIVPLYHLGNHARYHRYAYSALRRFPGVVVLHDGNLLPFVHALTLERGDRAAFLREAGFERGREGAAAAEAALHLACPLDLQEYPMLARVVRASLGVVVHSRVLRERVLQAYGRARVAVIPHLDLMPQGRPPISRAEAKSALGFDPADLLIGAFGFITPSKRLDRALAAFARLRGEFPQARFVCVGEAATGCEAMLEGLALGEAVQVTGYLPLEKFLRYLHAADIGVNMRYPTWGESSGTLARLMACAVPTLVTDAGAFAELPDETVVKVPPGPDEDAAIEEALRGLLSSAERRRAIGAAAQAFVARHGDPVRVAEQYAEFMRSVVAGGGRCTSSM